MAKSDLKTKPTGVGWEEFVAGIESPQRRDEARLLVELYRRVTGLPPRMWGPSIIGFGRYSYRYGSGREGAMCRAGFAPRKDRISLYMMGGYCNPQTATELDRLRGMLGKHKTGASCLYLGKLTDIDLSVLEEMVRVDFAFMNRRYPAADEPPQ